MVGALFDYADFGGTENLVINGTALELPNFGAAPAVVAGVNVTVTPPGGGSPIGQVALDGPLTSLAIGGQELGIDNVTFRAVPEPTSITLSALTILGGIAAVRKVRRK